MKQFTYLTIIIASLLFACGEQEQKSKIEAASSKQLEGVEYGLNDTTLTIENSCAMKSNDFDELYFVGAKLNNGEIGVWAIYGTKTNTRIHMTVNDIAKKYSDYPQNPKRGNMTHHGAQDVYDHLVSAGTDDEKE